MVRASRPAQLQAEDWRINGVGRQADPQDRPHPTSPILPRMLVPKNVTACSDGSRRRLIRSLEHVQVQLSLSYSRRGDLEIFLTSPMGTRSTLVAIRCETSQRVLRASGALPSLPRWDPIWVGLRRLV